MFKQGFSRNRIAVKLKISRDSVSNYLDPSFSVVHGHYGVKKKGILTPYLDEINIYVEQDILQSKFMRSSPPKGIKDQILQLVIILMIGE